MLKNNLSNQGGYVPSCPQWVYDHIEVINPFGVGKNWYVRHNFYNLKKESESEKNREKNEKVMCAINERHQNANRVFSFEQKGKG